jgi:hypothetical protein
MERVGTQIPARLIVRLLVGLLAGLAAGLAILATTASQARAQTQGAAALAFEVATIKPWGDTVTTIGGAAPRAQFHYVHPNSTNPLRGISGNRFTRVEAGKDQRTGGDSRHRSCGEADGELARRDLRPG